MFRQLPRSLLQRPTAVPVAVTINTFQKTKLSSGVCDNESGSSTRVFSRSFHREHYHFQNQVIFKSFTSQYRMKSTNPKKKDSTDVKSKPKTTSNKSRETRDEVPPSSSSPILSSEHIEIKPARQRLDQSASDLIVRKIEDEEKSRRRYEKEDPPEEERHKYHKKRPERSINTALMRTDYFDNMKEQNKDNFAFAIELFKEGDKHMRGHVEFIYVALKHMKKFGVHTDLDSYKKIIDVFPKGRMIQTNMFQMEFMHYPKHQQCGIDILEQMEDNGIIPDSEVHQMFTNIFGRWSFPMRKASRMTYWMPKFKYLSPWILPEALPDNALELAKLAVERMTSVDLTTKITVYDCANLEDAYDLTWIVSGQSPEQQALIEKLPSNRPIYVEGAFRVWLKNVCMNYFILRAEPKPVPENISDDDDVGSLHSVYEEEFLDKALAPVQTVHEQEDGVILGVCCTGTSSRDSVVSWIRFLEETNPRLGKDISVLFTLKSPIGPTDDIEILSYRDVNELKKLGKPRDPFTSSCDDELGLDPGMPDLRQVGVWTDSESKFPNWPHHFHPPNSISQKNKLDNERLIEETENIKQDHQKIGVDNSKTSETKQIK